MNTPALDLQAITCTFVSKDAPGQRYTAVHDVSLTVGEGEFVSVLQIATAHCPPRALKCGGPRGPVGGNCALIESCNSATHRRTKR